MTDRPKLRPFLAAEPAGNGSVHVYDRRHVGRAVRLARAELAWLELCDGTRTAEELAAAASAALGVRVPRARVEAVVAGLEEAVLLDGPRFRGLMAEPVRPPSCIGCYDADPAVLRQQCEALFTAPGGPGLPAPPRAGERPLRAVLVPHMDYARGGVCYGWGFKELAERAADVNLFFIVGTSHHSPYRFTLTRKHFASPLGVVETDRASVDRVAARYGDGLFDDEVCHLPEHAIELEVVLLQYLRPHRPFRIVPLLVGSFHDRVETGDDPAGASDIARMVEALRFAEAEAGEPVGYVISGDLAHIGPKFDEADPPASGSFLARSRDRDRVLLRHAEAADPGGYFRAIAGEGDARRICGLSPTWTVLAAAKPSRGRVLDYRQFVHPAGHESVSFASVAFDA